MQHLMMHTVMIINRGFYNHAYIMYMCRYFMDNVQSLWDQNERLTSIKSIWVYYMHQIKSKIKNIYHSEHSIIDTFKAMFMRPWS